MGRSRCWTKFSANVITVSTIFIFVIIRIERGIDISSGERNNTSDHQGKSVNVSQARLDIEAFSLLATISHLRIRAVTACSWSFRAADFASRIVSVSLNIVMVCSGNEY